MCANLSSKLVFSTLLLAQYGCYCECSWQMSPSLCITCVRYSCVEMCDFVCLIQSTVTMTVRPSAGGCCIGDVHSTNIKFNRWCQCWMARIPNSFASDCVWECVCVSGAVFVFVTWCMTIISFAILILFVFVLFPSHPNVIFIVRLVLCSL